jgi:hypothetical protein
MAQLSEHSDITPHEVVVSCARFGLFRAFMVRLDDQHLFLKSDLTRLCLSEKAEILMTHQDEGQEWTEKLFVKVLETGSSGSLVEIIDMASHQGSAIESHAFLFNQTQH